MLFTSYSFLLFIAVLLPVYYLVPGKLQRYILLIANLFFYVCAGIGGVIYMAVSICVTYLCARALAASFREDERFRKSEERKAMSKEERRAVAARGERKRKIWLIAGLCVNLGILAVLKYTGFILNNLGGIFNFTAAFDPVVPMGISFYTFRAVSYIIDVYWEKQEAEDSFINTALFISFFPLTVQGPIARFGEMRGSLFSPHKADFKTICFGLERVIWGYFKKLVIADRLLPAVYLICGSPEEYTGAWALLGALMYAAALYGDFTGGIDITIGIAESLGIYVPENFVRPFFSKNIAEYWRRWHISMGTWFKDYIFYPVSVSPMLLKLSKKLKKRSPALAKKLPVYISTIVTWFLTGLWHGAAWNFIVWGLLNAVIILLAEEIKPLTGAFERRFPRYAASKLRGALCMLRTFLIMCALRMLDCYRNVAVSFRAFFSIFTGAGFSGLVSALPSATGLTYADIYIAIAGIGLMFAVSLLQEKKGSVRKFLWEKNCLTHILFAALVIIILLFGAYGTGYDASQFIYNQF